jgi:hypothetical protein
MCRRRPMDSPDVLVDAARTVAGLDVARFEIDLRSHAIVEAFGSDLERARDRELPTFVFEDDGHQVSGKVAPDALVASDGGADVESVLRRFGPVAAAEVAACCDLPLARAQAELWQLASQWRARPEPVGGFGELWATA